MRKPLMALLIVLLLVLTVLGALLPILQGWIFLVLALYVFAIEFETGRVWVRRARRRWPALSRWIAAARGHRWAPRQLHTFDEVTDPSKNALIRDHETGYSRRHQEEPSWTSRSSRAASTIWC